VTLNLAETSVVKELTVSFV